MSTTVQSTSAADLLRLSADGQRYELIRGERRQMAPDGPTHGRLAMRIAAPHLGQDDERDIHWRPMDRRNCEGSSGRCC
jgi:hypothetical protein